MDRGRVWVADDFDAPLPDDLLKEFYGGELPKLERPKAQMKYLLDTVVWLWSVGSSESESATPGLKFFPMAMKRFIFPPPVPGKLASRLGWGNFELPEDAG